MGLKPSGPGDFLFLKILNTFLSCVVVNQISCSSCIVSVLILYSVYSVSSVSVTAGKCVFSRNFSVSVPGSVTDPSPLFSMP